MSRYLLPFSLGLAIAAPAVADPIEGVWSNPRGSVTVRVSPCGGTYCGTVIRADDRAEAAAARKGNRLVGTQLLSGLKPHSSGKWRGRVFVPDHGITASANVSLVGTDRMKVQGCAVGGMMCKSQTWARVGN